MLKVVLIRPEIPGNTGNVGRSCAAAGVELHLVKPLGFELTEARLRRAGLDYWGRLAPRLHDCLESFLAQLPADAPLLAFSAEGEKTHWQAPYSRDCWLVFGGESAGLPLDLRERWHDHLYRVPMLPGNRSLNLSATAAVVIYEARRILGGPPPWDHGPTRP
ncbi:MAG: tRNA (cytidine(34)-2'-O)-methyltransferase [Elusimicrobiota bacterium]